MLFENLVSLIDGELKSTPSIASFTNIIFDAKKVKRGDLFFGESQDIELALQNGAYGIASNKFRVKDKEIAWIKVKNIKEAKLKFLRYLIVKASSSIVLLNQVELSIAKSISDEKLILLDSNIEKSIKELNTLYHDENCILFLEDIVYEKLELPVFQVEIKRDIKEIKSTLFVSTFVYHDRKYSDIKLPFIFRDELERVLNIFDDFKLSYSIEKLNFISHFKPLFLDSHFRQLSFGSGTKVVIVESQKELILKELSYIRQKAPWAKVLLLLPENIKLSKKMDVDIKYFKNSADLKKLNIFSYNHTLMLDMEKKFEKYLQKTKLDIKTSLF